MQFIYTCICVLAQLIPLFSMIIINEQNVVLEVINNKANEHSQYFNFKT